MKNTSLIALGLIVTFVASGCGAEPETAPSPVVTQQPPETPTAAVGFPCDVHAVLKATCASCHAGHLYYGPNFDSREDMFRPAAELFQTSLKPVAPGTLGEHLATALREGTMPPYGAPARPTPAQATLVTSWVAAGMPAGDCGGLSSTP